MNIFNFFESLHQHTELWNTESLLPRRLYFDFEGWGSERQGEFSLFDVYQKVSMHEAGSWSWLELRSLILLEEQFEGSLDGQNISSDIQPPDEDEEPNFRRLLRSKPQKMGKHVRKLRDRRQENSEPVDTGGQI